MAGWHHIEVLEWRRMDERRYRGRPEAETQRRFEELRHAWARFAGLPAEQILAGIGLRIEIDHKGSRPFVRMNRRQIADDRRLAHPTLLIEYHAPHVRLPLFHVTRQTHSLPWCRRALAKEQDAAALQLTL
jgi:hypothetical protein